MLIEEILTERIREMHAEGYRSHELRRLGALTRGTVKFLPGDRTQADCGQQGCDPIEWNDRRLIWLIPNGELQINPLAQNP